MNKIAFAAVALLFSSQALAAPSVSITCATDTVSFAMTNLAVGETFTLEVSQSGNGNWISLGGAEAPSASLTVPANVSGSDELDALTNSSAATYRVTSGGASATAFCP